MERSLYPALSLWLLGCGPTQDRADSGHSAATEPAIAVAPEDQLAYVGQTVQLDTGGSSGSAAVWDFGDGTTAAGHHVAHVWTEPGRYRVRLDIEGSPPASDSFVMTIVNEPLVEPPTATGRIAAFGDGLLVTLEDHNQVAVVTGETITRHAVCRQPLSVSVGPDSIGVSCRDEAVVYAADFTPLVHYDTPGPLLWHGQEWVHLAQDGTLSRSDDTQTALAGRVLLGLGELLLTASFLAAGDQNHWWMDGTQHTLQPDPGPDSDTNARGVPNLLGTGAVRPDGGVVVWGGLKANTARGLFLEDTPHEHDNVVRAHLCAVDLATGLEREGPIFDNRDRVGAVVFTPEGDRLLVAHHGTGIVDILDAYTFQRLGGFQNVGMGLDGLWTDGRVVAVLASLDRELITYDLTAGNAQIELARVRLTEDEILPADVVLGKRIFHAASDAQLSLESYISCASCHPDGGQDGLVWDFTQRGEGLRNTLPLWNMPPDGPFHWSANFDELQDFENDIREHQEGLGYLSEADWAECSDPLGVPKAGRSTELDALAAYMHFIAAQGPPGGTRSEDIEALDEAGCTACHAGTLGTDAGWADGAPIVHDVGTIAPASGGRLGASLAGIRTPSLLGTRLTPPYLHDGSADDLITAIEAHAPVDDPALMSRILAHLSAR